MPNDRRGIESRNSEVSSCESAGNDNTQPVSEIQQHHHVDHAGQVAKSDTFELIKALVQDLLLERHGYIFDCSMAEPPLFGPEAVNNSFSPPARPDALRLSSLSSAQACSLLMDFQRFMGWQDTKLVNIDSLHALARALIEHLPDFSFSSVSATVAARHLPVDSVALMLGALALGAVATGELGNGKSYFDLSTEMTKHFVGHATLDSCLSLFLQHVFALRIGTLSYAQSIMLQTIHNAHDLGLHRNTHGTRGLQLYLLIYMADQYCSLTHNTEPIIQSFKLQDQIFAPLSNAKPQLRTLIDLVSINGYVIGHSHQLQHPSQNEILELESKIGGLCSRLIGPVPVQSTCGGFRTAYEPLARVHMLCCRLKLRAPGLLEQASWLPSLCICVHAAEGVLSTYFQLYYPVLAVLVKQNDVQEMRNDRSLMPTACKLATTWRQVKRIMMAAFVIIFAYYHGEMIHEEASRYLAMARLLLEYPRWRWGEKLDEAIQTLVDISSLSGFRLYVHTQLLLPGANEQFLQTLHCPQQVAIEPTAATHDFITGQPELHNGALSTPAPWYSVFESISNDDIFGPNIDTYQNQISFGLWDTIGCPVEGGS